MVFFYWWHYYTCPSPTLCPPPPSSPIVCVHEQHYIWVPSLLCTTSVSKWITRLPSFRALIFKLDIINRTTNGFMKTRWDHADKILSTVMAHQNGSVMLAICAVNKGFLPKWTVLVHTLWYPWLYLCPDEKFQVRWLWESETQYETLSLKSRGQANPNNQAGGEVSIF